MTLLNFERVKIRIVTEIGINIHAFIVIYDHAQKNSQKNNNNWRHLKPI